MNVTTSPAGAPVLVVTYQEAGEMLGGPKKPLSTRHIERLVKAKKLRAIGRSRARRVVYQSILNYLEKEAG